MGVGEIKRDLDVFVGVFNHDDAVVVNVCVLPFAFEEDCATRLYFGRSELGRLKNETALTNVSGVVAALADLVAGAPDAPELAVKMQSQTKAIVLRVFIFDLAN